MLQNDWRRYGILEKNPRVVLEQGRWGNTLLHWAAVRSSPEFCKVLLEFDPTRESLHLRNVGGNSPLLDACFHSNLDTARFLLEIHPGGIYEMDIDGYNCLHLLLSASNFDDCERLIEFVESLLKNAEWLISAPTRDGNRNLPLHVAFKEGNSLCVLQFLYNIWPEVIYMANSRGLTPLAEAMLSDGYENDEQQDAVISFFQDQLAIVDEARNDTTPDERGQLPIHRAMLNVDLPLGTVKLMINPRNVLVADRLGQTPLHIACQHCTFNIIYCLVGAHPRRTLLIPDSSGDLPLHVACRYGYGRFSVVKWILGRAASGVSVENDNGKLPVEMLLYEADCDRNSLEYVQAVYALIRAHPESVTCFLA
jgi:ankyrin repeat protein